MMNSWAKQDADAYAVADWRIAAWQRLVAGARNTQFLRLVEKAIPRLAA